MPIGTIGAITVRQRRGRVVAETRVRDSDGRVRQVRVHGSSAAQARARLKVRIRDRPGFDGTGALRLDSSFTQLAELWLADLAGRAIADSTKKSYRDQLRLHVGPAFAYFTLAELTTGRVELFLRSQAASSYSQARLSRTVLNLMFAFAMRQDALARNPVEGTSELSRPKGTPKALTVEQIWAIRRAAAAWRTEAGLPGPKSDGQVRDILEVLLGTAMRPGEVLALRPVDLVTNRRGMVAHVCGTVVPVTGRGTVRQDHPKTDASNRYLAVPPFAAKVLRRRASKLGPDDQERTIFASRRGDPLAPHNVRRTFREFLQLADLQDSGISLRWYRRTGATVVARAMGKEAAATLLGHTSAVVTEGHYIEPERLVDPTPATHLERTLRPVDAHPDLLHRPTNAQEDSDLDELDGRDEVGA